MDNYGGVMLYCGKNIVSCANEKRCEKYDGEIRATDYYYLDFSCGGNTVYVNSDDQDSISEYHSIAAALNYILRRCDIDLEDSLKILKLKSEICKKK